MAFRLIPYSADGIKSDCQNETIFSEGLNRINRATPFYGIVGIRVREGAITRAMGRAVIRSMIRATISTCFLNDFFRFFISQVFMFIRRHFFGIDQCEAIYV